MVILEKLSSSMALDRRWCRLVLIATWKAGLSLTMGSSFLYRFRIVTRGAPIISIMSCSSIVYKVLLSLIGGGGSGIGIGRWNPSWSLNWITARNSIAERSWWGCRLWRFNDNKWKIMMTDKIFAKWIDLIFCENKIMIKKWHVVVLFLWRGFLL